KRLVEFFLLHAGRFALRVLDGSRREKFVEQDRHRMGEVENWVVRGGRDGGQQVASPKFLIEETEVFATEEDRHPAGHCGDSRDGPYIPLVLRLHEDDADRRHGALDILYRRYSLACASPSRSRTMEARSSATNASPTDGPSKGSVSPRCEPARSFRIRGNHSFGARAERIGV